MNNIHTPALMCQGTASNAGKSVLVAGICRLLARKGYNVAPFKAQNMALNSYVTSAGEEIGRAQALQALACGLEPSALMNPVLLKPLGNHLSQIILMGKPREVMSYREFTKIKPAIWNEVKEAYFTLAKDRDIIILEGAGSPAEINLQHHDIVNMRMARAAHAKVALVADIDRGGAFAALLGTMSLLPREDRKMVKGFILNKFRGDKNLLEPAIKTITQKTGRPFVGIMPMLDLQLPEEDSVTFQSRLGRCKNSVCPDNYLDIAIVNMPALSNMTDWDPFAHESHVNMRVVAEPGDLGHPDLLILGGCRNVAHAMAHLRHTGIDKAIMAYTLSSMRKKRGNIVGICGGLQLLGTAIHDPQGIEKKGTTTALGLLQLATRMEEKKILKRSTCLISSGIAAGEHHCSGYEIHHGQSYASGATAAMWDNNGQPVGWISHSPADQPPRVWGTYLHGIFDNDEFRHVFLNRLRAEAGLPEQNRVAYALGDSLDILADAVEENLNLTGFDI